MMRYRYPLGAVWARHHPGLSLPAGFGQVNDEAAVLAELKAARRTELYITLGGGAVSLVTLMLTAAGYTRAATAVSAVGIITGTIYAAVRLAEGD